MGDEEPAEENKETAKTDRSNIHPECTPKTQSHPQTQRPWRIAVG